MSFSVQNLVMTLVKSATGGLKGPLTAALVTFLVAIPLALVMPIIDRDEGRFVQATTQMLETGDYININYQDTPRHKKPIGIHWFQAASVKATSKVEARDPLSFRWPSILGAALAAFACAWGASRLFGTKVGYKAGFLFGVSFMLATEAFIAKTDALMTGFTTLVMSAFALIYLATRNLEREDEKPDLTKEKLVFWFALAFAILIKGPIGPLFVLTTSLCLWAFDRKANFLRYMGWGWGFLIVLAVCGPWAVMITVATDGAFWGSSLGHDMGQKLVSGSEGHGVPPGAYTALLPILIFPAGWLLGGALQTGIFRHREAAIRFAIAWFLPAFLVFELIPTKLPHYVLPAFGGLIWLCVASLDVPTQLWAKVLNWVFGLIGSVALVVVAYVLYRDFGTPSLWFYLVIIGLSAAFMAAWGGHLLHQRFERAGLVFLVGSGLVAHLSFFLLAANLKPLWLSRSAAAAIRAADLDPRSGEVTGPVAVLGYAEPSLVFQLGTRTELMNENASLAAEAFRAHRPVLVESRMKQAFFKAIAATPKPVTSVSGTNYNNEGRKETLEIYYLDSGLID